MYTQAYLYYRSFFKLAFHFPPLRVSPLHSPLPLVFPSSSICGSMNVCCAVLIIFSMGFPHNGMCCYMALGVDAADPLPQACKKRSGALVKWSDLLSLSPPGAVIPHTGSGVSSTAAAAGGTPSFTSSAHVVPLGASGEREKHGTGMRICISM
jgi:hypothetical protein